MSNSHTIYESVLYRTQKIGHGGGTYAKVVLDKPCQQAVHGDLRSAFELLRQISLLSKNP